MQRHDDAGAGRAFDRARGILPSDPELLAAQASWLEGRRRIEEARQLWLRLLAQRPEAPEVLQYYTPEEMYKFALKPGITGLAQINGRGLLNWGETLAWDLQYVRTRSVWLDLKIIAITLKHVITRHGAF